LDRQHGLEDPVAAHRAEVRDPQLELVGIEDDPLGVFSVDPHADSVQGIFIKALSHTISLYPA
jgi:hypothetical protein